MSGFLFSLKIPDQVKSLLLTILLVITGVVLSALIVWKGLLIGFGLLGVLLGIPLLAICILFPHYGYFIAFFLSSFVFLAKRFVDLPFGSIPELLMLASCLGLLLQKKKTKTNERNNILQNPITIIITIWVIYLLIQAFNPNATSINGWLFGTRGFLNLIGYYTVSYFVFSQKKNLLIFIKLWIGIAILVALYGLYQEFAGLPSYDLAWVTSTKELIGLNFIQGRWRKWSFLSDCTAFGIFMAISAIFCFILILGPYSKRKKVILGFSGLLMLLAMSYSGTRTAYAMIPAGFLIYGLLTINRTSTIAFGVVSVILFIGILFVPVYNPTLSRIRTTFSPSEDASMNVRNFNRAIIQPYIHTHPLGGGLSTTGDNGVRFAPNHYLAGFPPDSGYLQITLETGWVGLIITIILYGTIMITGINNFFKIKDKQGQNLLAAFIAAFFALTIAFYTQVSITQLPINFICYACYVLMYKFPALYSTESQQEN